MNALQDEDFQTDNYLYPFFFTPAYMTKVNGLAVTFAMDLKFVAVDKQMCIRDSRMNAGGVLNTCKSNEALYLISFGTDYFVTEWRTGE